MLPHPRFLFTTAVLLIVSFLGATRAAAKKGDIVPLTGHGVKVEMVDKKKTAVCDLEGGSLKVVLTTSSGYLFLDITLNNAGEHPVALKPGNLTLISAGTDIDPLDPDNYIHSFYQVPPYEIDSNGEIRDDKEKGKMIPYSPGDTAGGGLAEKMAATDMEKYSSSQRMKVTKELLELKKDVLSHDSNIESGATVKSRRIYQRNGLELPLMVRFKGEMGRVTIHFDREK